MDHGILRSPRPEPPATAQADQEKISALNLKAPPGLRQVFFSSHSPWIFLPWLSSPQQSFTLTKASIRISGHLRSLSLQLYQNLLSRHKATLEELTILIANRAPTPVNDLRLMELTALRKLTLINFIDTNPVPFITPILAQARSSLETIHLCMRHPPDTRFNELALYLTRDCLPAFRQLILSPSYTIPFHYHGMNMSRLPIQDIVVEVDRLHHILELQEGHGVSTLLSACEGDNDN